MRQRRRRRWRWRWRIICWATRHHDAIKVITGLEIDRVGLEVVGLDAANGHPVLGLGVHANVTSYEQRCNRCGKEL